MSQMTHLNKLLLLLLLCPTEMSIAKKKATIANVMPTNSRTLAVLGYFRRSNIPPREDEKASTMKMERKRKERER
ncbi:hypothetical protein BVC80_1553g5 [Macleaya cordata]|uniref:Secreted protein n=1 Tax=Macleaya cordata TaxID=56857 RepID=A0A200QY50_MACCD|nr:hypothetical protein BVC80_1553g5 [Macleaya cordata]